MRGSVGSVRGALAEFLEGQSRVGMRMVARSSASKALTAIPPLIRELQTLGAPTSPEAYERGRNGATEES